MRAVTATRYVTPLREGGSLPGLMEADDLGTYVVKFRGAGQGPKALVSEVVCANLARALGLPVPDLVTVELDPLLAANEPDEEVQALLRASPGTNLGVDFLPGALDLDPEAFEISGAFAGRVLWFDALVSNVDRTWRNPNLLFWHGRPYLIDHGATLTWAHDWTRSDPTRAYTARDHVLIGCAPDLDSAEDAYAPMLTDTVLADAVAAVPEQWLAVEAPFAEVDEVRSGYVAALARRFEARSAWLVALAEAVAAHEKTGWVRTRRNRPRWLGEAGR
jgi:hypothetical protein